MKSTIEDAVLAQIEELFKTRRRLFVKRMSYRAGGVPNAEDVVQEAFTRALKYAKTFDSNRAEIGQWFNTILNNALRDAKAEQRREGMVVPRDDLTEPLDKSMYDVQLLGRVMEKMNKRSKGVAEVLKLYLFFGYKAREIEEITEYKRSYINKVVADFRKEIRDEYETVCS